MNKRIPYALVLLGLLSICVSVRAAENENPFLGRWALTIPNGRAGWLSVEQKEGYLDASILWGGGSVVPVANVIVDGEILYVTRVHRIERKDAAGKVVRVQTLTETIMGRILDDTDTLHLMHFNPNRNGKGAKQSKFTGKRIPPLPPRPDLSGARYGKPIVLFDGKNLDAWKLTNPGQTNGWSVEDGVLVNKPIQQKGKRHISYGNLRTVEEFEDFNLKLQV
ncbi:MAG: 3-keto-disaccharide hydrolase, partial [Planctomycetota bacterium]